MLEKKIYKGNVEITKNNVSEWEEKLKGIDEISGDLYINSNASLKALKSVGGYLYINSNASLKALKSVGGYLYINSNASLKALKSVGGDLSIYSNASLKADALKSVGGDLSIYSNASLKALKSVGGYLYINSNASLKADALKSVGGDLYIYSKLGFKLEKQLWKYNHKRHWYMTDNCSEWLLKRKGDIVYKIDNVAFDKKLFDMTRKDKLSASEVFAITNMEQRRIAYARMDKTKMKALPNFKIIDKVSNDGQGYPMKLISFEIQGFDKPFRFLNCFCPSTKREYFLETQEDTCSQAKAKSFGLDDEKVEFICEW